MKFWKKLMRIFGDSEKNRHQADVQFRVEAASVKRQLADMRRRQTACRNEALYWEKNGDHNKALTKAAQANAIQKSYDTIDRNLDSIVTGNELNKQFDSIRKANELIFRMGQTVLDGDMTEELAGMEAQRAMTIDRMEESKAMMNAIMEDTAALNDDGLAANSAAEEALAELMRDAQPPWDAPLPRWAAAQRRTLRQIAAE